MIKLIIWRPDNCVCVADQENQTLIEKCTLHNTYAECLAANQNLNMQFGSNPTQAQQRQMQQEKSNLKKQSKRRN